MRRVSRRRLSNRPLESDAPQEYCRPSFGFVPLFPPRSPACTDKTKQPHQPPLLPFPGLPVISADQQPVYDDLVSWADTITGDADTGNPAGALAAMLVHSHHLQTLAVKDDSSYLAYSQYLSS